MKEKPALIVLVVIGSLTIIVVAVVSFLNIQLAPVYSLILTATFVAVTAIYVYFTSQAVKASNKQAEIMLNAEFNAAAPVIKLHAGTNGSNVNVDFQNVGKGPALNFKCWIDDEEHPELRASNRMTYRTAIGTGEVDNFVFDTGITDYKLGIGFVKCQYESIFKKIYESYLIFSTDPIPELKYGEFKRTNETNQVVQTENNTDSELHKLFSELNKNLNLQWLQSLLLAGMSISITMIGIGLVKPTAPFDTSNLLNIGMWLLPFCSLGLIGTAIKVISDRKKI